MAGAVVAAGEEAKAVGRIAGAGESDSLTPTVLFTNFP